MKNKNPNYPLDRHMLSEGEQPTLQQVLLDREGRVTYQTQLRAQYSNQTLIVLKVNMPGPVKSNAFVSHLLLIGKTLLLDSIEAQGLNIMVIKEVKTLASQNVFVVVNTDDAYAVKRLTAAIEDSSDIGRLFDFDVYINDETISRQSLNYPARKCYICDKDAKECGRQRTHTVEELLDAMYEIVSKEGRQ